MDTSAFRSRITVKSDGLHGLTRNSFVKENVADTENICTDLHTSKLKCWILHYYVLAAILCLLALSECCHNSLWDYVYICTLSWTLWWSQACSKTQAAVTMVAARKSDITATITAHFILSIYTITSTTALIILQCCLLSYLLNN
jgi:hypothetical protein